MENKIILNTTYGEFRDALKNELQKSAEGFVKIGYLLKMARDSDILRDSRYMTVNEFAKEEFGLTKDQVSRFIAINERFSEGGNSDRLDERYAAFGYAKLTEILTLPDEVISTLSPEMTRREIQDVKKDIKEEEKISDVEVILEGQREEQKELNNLQKVLHQYFYENREEYLNIGPVIRSTLTGAEEIEKTLDVLAPSGIAVKTVRIRGVGLFMLSIKGKDKSVELLNTRTNEKEEYPWTIFITELQELFGHRAGKAEWSERYGEPFEQNKQEEKPEVAPVQPESRDEETVPKTLHDIEKSIPEPEPEPEEEPEEAPKETGEEEIEEQVEGQTCIEKDFPEYMPEPEVIDVEATQEEESSWEDEVEAGIELINRLWEDFTSVERLLGAVRDLETKLENVAKAGGRNEK